MLNVENNGYFPTTLRPGRPGFDPGTGNRPDAVVCAGFRHPNVASLRVTARDWASERGYPSAGERGTDSFHLLDGDVYWNYPL